MCAAMGSAHSQAAFFIQFDWLRPAGELELVTVTCLIQMKPNHTVYFDYNATTPLDSQVREAMLPFLAEVWGNPSSVHQIGRRARAILDDARDRTAKVFGCKPSEVIFTSGGT